MQQRLKISWRFFGASLLFFGLLIGEVQDVNATVTIHGVSPSFSGGWIDSANKSAWKAYAGYAGAANTCVYNGDGTCNNCGALNTTPTIASGLYNYTCNRQGIDANTPFQIRISSSDAANYPATTCTSLIHAYKDSNDIATLTNGSYSSSADSIVTATMTWGQICNAFGKTNCTGSFTGTLSFGFNKDCTGGTAATEKGTVQFSFRYINDSPYQALGCDQTTSQYSGICDYTVYPGDEKVYVDVAAYLDASSTDLVAEDLTQATGGAGSNSKDESGMKIDRLRLYYSNTPGSFNGITAAGSSYKDILISGTKVQDRKVTGLTNEQTYVFVAANVDQGGNEHYFFATDSAGMDPRDGESIGAIGTTQAATPQEVYGLLDNHKCFIATAAYGSGDTEGVKTLRLFRDRYLVNWSGGQWFIRQYYKYSPPIAEFISEKVWLKSLVRTMLEPMVMMASVLLRFGIFGLFAFFSIVGLTFYSGIRWLRRGATS